MKELEDTLDNLQEESEEFYELTKKIYDLIKQKKRTSEQLRELIRQLIDIDNVDLEE